MKTIKIKFMGFWPTFDPKNAHYMKLLYKNYNVVECEDADYIICSLFDEPYCYLKEEGKIRLFFSGENYIPDFNLIDYAICSYPIDYYDRNFYWPECVFPNGHFERLRYRRTDFTELDLAEKPYFANFIASHDSEYNLRSRFVEILNRYKRVECPGTFMNNMLDGFNVSFTDNSKTDFQKKSKFTVCFESTEHYGFITEKITDAFYSETIPIYFGSANVTDIFNKEAFINVSDYPSLEAAAEKVIELDQNNELYLEMLNRPALVDPEYYEKLVDSEEKFLKNIFEQDYDKARRISPFYNTKRHISFLKNAVNDYEGINSVSRPSGSSGFSHGMFLLAQFIKTLFHLRRRS